MASALTRAAFAATAERFVLHLSAQGLTIRTATVEDVRENRRPLRRQGAELGCPIRSAREVAALLTAQPVANRKEKNPG
jgi:hypothetical protein